MNKLNFISCVLTVVVLAPTARAADRGAGEIDHALKLFSSAWTADAWLPHGRSGRPGYLRPADDAGWKARFMAYRTLISAGPRALPTVRHLLKQGTPAERVLAAQALSFLPAGSCRAELIDAARDDSEPAVRLYAIDALSLHDGKSHQRLFEDLKRTEKSRDVKRHLAYALERRADSAARDAASALRAWDAKTLDSARVGQPAPDFELRSITGRRYRLGSFRGKMAVVLVFVYGDT